jgi:diguanylate cyclase (GGDEF)-like protein
MQPVVSELSSMVWLVAAQFLLYAAGWGLFALALRESRAALLHWGGFMLMLGLGFVLASQRGEPRTWVPYLGANLCFLVAFLVLRRGVEVFLDSRPADREQVLTFIVLASAYTAAGLDPQNSHWRVLLAYGAGAWLVARTMVALTPGFRREFGRRASWLLAAPGALVVSLFGYRVVQQLANLGHNYEMHRLTDSNQRLLFGYLFGAAMFNFTFMGLTMLRLVTRLRAQTRQDPLTGLCNRRALEQAVDDAWRRWRRGAGCFAVLALDLDHFKRINDTHGHAVGDRVLQQVASRLMAVVRSIDTVARTGGEEFIVLVPQVGLDGARAAAERLRAAIRMQPFEGPRGPLTITVSVGVALAQEADAEPREVLQRADQALYRAKEGGRDRIELAL